MKNSLTARGRAGRRLPLFMRAGFLLLGLGLALDLAYHFLSVALGSGEPSHSGAFATALHTLVLGGMAVTFGGLLHFALSSHRAVDRKER